MKKLIVLLALFAFGVALTGCHAEANGHEHGASVDVGTH